MSPSPPNRPDDEADHPHLLPWYVSGALGQDESRKVELHLASCAECRKEVQALTSMKETMTRNGRSDHITEEELVAWETSGLQDEPERRRGIEAHLDSCEACRQDLDALVSARKQLAAGRTEPAAVINQRPPSRSPGAPWKWGFFAASAIAAALAVAVVTMRIQEGEPPFNPSTVATPPVPASETPASAPPEVPTQPRGDLESDADSLPVLEESSAVILHPSQRGDSPILTLNGHGPWALTVVLPFNAPDGDYRLHVEREDGSTVPGTSTSATARPDGTATLHLGRFPSAGRYRLVLTPAGKAGGRSYSYEFQRPVLENDH